jgi:hypothetical protein
VTSRDVDVERGRARSEVRSSGSPRIVGPVTDASTVSLERALLMPTATLSLAAAGIHFAVIQEHLDEYALFGYLFLVLAWFQAIWPIPFVMRRSALLGWLAVVVNLGAVLVWIWSRTTGLPIGADPGKPEPLGALDVAASVFEIVLVIWVLLLMTHRTRGALEARKMPARDAWLAAAMSSALIVVVASAAFVAPVAGSMG